MKAVIYTALFGDYDDLPDVLDVKCAKKFRHVCITDKKRKAKGWEYIIREERGGPVKSNRYWKMHPHILFSGHDINVYLDSIFQVYDYEKLRFLCRRVKKDKNLDLFAYKSPRWRTVLQEVEFNISLGKGDPDRLRGQYKRYKQNGFKDDLGVISGGFQIRKGNSRDLDRLLNTWWSEVVNTCFRDQLCLPYCMWRCKFKKYEVFSALRKYEVVKKGYHKGFDKEAANAMFLESGICNSLRSINQKLKEKEK